jgi:glutathione S-transferase
MLDEADLFRRYVAERKPMKFYDCAIAPSPRRVRVFMVEKGITVPTIQVDLRKGEQFGEAFRAVNPDCTVPVLELDDGRKVTDSVGICLYLEETHPQPPLMGADAADRAIVAEWQRRAERDGFLAVAEAFRNSTPAFKTRALPGADDYVQIPALVERGRARTQAFFKLMNARLAEREFVAGDRYTIADITTMIAVDFAGWIKLTIPDDCPHLRRWHQAVSARPSARA